MNSRPLTSKSRRLALASLFAVIIFLSKAFLPPPIDDMFLIVQILLLVTSALLMGPPGATYVSTLSGILKSVVTAGLAPFTIGLAVLYGVLTDGLLVAFRARGAGGEVRTTRTALAAGVSTALTGLISYYVTVGLFQLNLPGSFMIDMAILLGGTISGFIGGWAATFIWKRYLVSLTAPSAVPAAQTKV
jgi:hypothetical protein